MLPDLEKIIRSDREARALVAQAKKEAQVRLDQAQIGIEAIQAKFQGELAHLQEAVQEEILRQAEARAAEVAASTERYIAGLREKQGTHGEEVAAFLLSRVLAE
jgi:vacuolar-type H+-ATPase subunit H